MHYKWVMSEKDTSENSDSESGVESDFEDEDLDDEDYARQNRVEKFKCAVRYSNAKREGVNSSICYEHRAVLFKLENRKKLNEYIVHVTPKGDIGACSEEDYE